MNSISHASLGHQFGDLQGYDTDILAASDNSDPSSRIAYSHLSPKMGLMERGISIESHMLDFRDHVQRGLPSRSVSLSPHVGGPADPVHRPQSPNSGTPPSYFTSSYTPAPTNGPDFYPMGYPASNIHAQREGGLYYPDTDHDTSFNLPIASGTHHEQARHTSAQSLIPLPRQRSNTYVSQLEVCRSDLY